MIDYASPMTRDFLTTGSSVPIIDLHAHMFNCYECEMICDTPEKQIAAMDRSGVALAVMISHDALYGGYPYFDADLEAARKFPGRFLLYQCVYTPNLDPERDLAWFESHPEAVGFKFHADTYRVPLTDPVHDEYFSYADRHGLPVLFHTWGGSPYDGEKEGEKLLEKYPNMSFIAGHSFRDRPQEAIRLAKRYPNLYLEMTAVLSQRGVVDSFVKEGLEDRIVFGVDAPWFSYPFGIGALLSAEMTDEAREKILYKNALRILRKGGAPLPENLADL